MAQSPLDEQRQRIVEDLAALFGKHRPTSPWHKWLPLVLGILGAVAGNIFFAGEFKADFGHLKERVAEMRVRLDSHHDTLIALVRDMKHMERRTEELEDDSHRHRRGDDGP